MNWDHVLSRFRGLRAAATAGYWSAFCPRHKGGQERRPSLRLWIGRDGRLMIGCWTCGRNDTAAKREILALVGLRMTDLFPDDDRSTPPRPDVRPKVVQKFDYRDEQGVTLYQVWRYEPKGFCQMRREGNVYRPGLGDNRRVLYGLPTLLAGPSTEPILFVEGERKADLLVRWGFKATCGAGGAGMGWNDSYALWVRTFLPHAPCVVLPDNDPPGFRLADAVAGSLLRLGAPQVGCLLLPGLPPKGDVLDFAKAGGTAKQLHDLLQHLPLYTRAL